MTLWNRARQRFFLYENKKVDPGDAMAVWSLGMNFSAVIAEALEYLHRKWNRKIVHLEQDLAGSVRRKLCTEFDFLIHQWRHQDSVGRPADGQDRLD